MQADRAFGIGIVVASGLIALAASDIRVLAGYGLSARFFPYLLSAILAAGGLVLAVRPGHQRLGDVTRRIAAPSTLLMIAAFLVYAFTFRYVDFRLGTWLFTLIAMAVLGSRKPLELIVAPAAISLITFYLFRYGFTVMLPTWT